LYVSYLNNSYVFSTLVHPLRFNSRYVKTLSCMILPFSSEKTMNKCEEK
jgi:hypothetical protein